MTADTLKALPQFGAAARSWIDEAIFAVFLLAVFIGVTPFKNGDALAGEVVVQTGAGDSLRQLCYLAIFTLAFGRAIQRRGIGILTIFPPVLMLLVAWCLLSAAWSPEPFVTIRRAGLAAVLVTTAFLAIDALPLERGFTWWRWVLAVALIVNLAAVMLVPAAVHPYGEIDPQLVGNWRGVYGHKNIAGSVAAITVLAFLFRGGRTVPQRCFDLFIAALAILFLVGTRSKSSMGLLVVGAFAGVAYGLAFRRSLDRAILIVAAALLLVVLGVALADEREAIRRLLEDPTQFTGRTEIWRAEMAFIADHPLLGSGFGVFSNTGKTSPLTPYISSWVTGAHNGHNGYLQLLVTTGVIGLVLGLVALVLSPLAGFWRLAKTPDKAFLFALFSFLLLHNLMETDFLEGDGVTWVSLLLLLALLRHPRREPA